MKPREPQNRGAMGTQGAQAIQRVQEIRVAPGHQQINLLELASVSLVFQPNRRQWVEHFLLVAVGGPRRRPLCRQKLINLTHGRKKRQSWPLRDASLIIRPHGGSRGLRCSRGPGPSSDRPLHQFCTSGTKKKVLLGKL